MSKRVGIYVRVSTVRQADHGASLPDQLKQAREYCKKRGWQIAREYVEAGASARSDKRPEFRRMIREACIDPSPYDVILVHSLSRFYRDAIDQGVYRRRLEKHGVLLASVTQNFGEGAQAELIQTVLAAADAHTSAETAKHVSRSMKENARQGFWNGSRPPLGYRTYTAEMRGEKAKKKLEVDPKSAELVRLIFRLFTEGDGQTGPMGVKQVASYLNRHSHKTQSGGPFYISTVHAILTRSTYAGVHYYNRHDSRTRKLRPRDEWIAVRVPVIIPEKLFEDVQRRLRARSPSKSAPRQLSSSVLLSGLARCGGCGGNLMLTTGKSNQYRYYSCASQALKGDCTCGKPIRIPEGKLDAIVTGALSERLFEPQRLRGLLAEAVKLARGNSRGDLSDLKLLRRELKETDRKVARLFEALTSGDAGDTKGFRDHQAELEGRREELARLIAVKERDLSLPAGRLTNRQVERCGKALSGLLQGGPRAFRKEYMRLLVHSVEVTKDEVRISGSKAALAAAVQAQKTNTPQVSGFVREWRTRQDSNL